jgi:hypothetical protein
MTESAIILAFAAIAIVSGLIGYFVGVFHESLRRETLLRSTHRLTLFEKGSTIMCVGLHCDDADALALEQTINQSNQYRAWINSAS